MRCVSMLLLLVVPPVLAACGDDRRPAGGPDAGPDAAMADAGLDAGPARDAGPERDGGPPDAGDPEEDAGLSCFGDRVACGGSCVDVTTSIEHCGACGRACEGTDACVRGHCQHRLTAADPERAAMLGTAVALSGDVALVGAYLDDARGDNAGAAHVFERQADGSWSGLAPLEASGAAANDQFGKSVAVRGMTALVGAPNANGGTGAAYLYERQSDGTWPEVERLIADDALVDAEFGGAVALGDGLALVGAPADDGAASGAGAVYVFERQTDGSWTQAQKVTSSDTLANARFGSSLSFRSPLLLVGARGDPTHGFLSGSAYLLERGTDGRFTGVDKWFASDAEGGQEFGYAVALGESHAVVGAPDTDASSVLVDVGAAYLFERAGGTWSETERLGGAGVGAGRFGNAVAADGAVAIVCGPREASLGSYQGRCVVYTRSSGGDWRSVETLWPSDPLPGMRFGWSVAYEADVLLAGATFDDVEGVDDAGAAYILEGVPP